VLCGRRTALQLPSCAALCCAAGPDKAACVSCRRPAEGRVSQNIWKRSQADRDSWLGLFDTQASPMAKEASQKGCCASLPRAPMSARHEEKRSGPVLQEVKPIRKLAIHATPRWPPSAFEAVLESNLFVTLPVSLVMYSASYFVGAADGVSDSLSGCAPINDQLTPGDEGRFIRSQI
jgi:hypothetical protein